MIFDKLTEAHNKYCQEAHHAVEKFADELNKVNGRTDIVYLLVDFLYEFLPNRSECSDGFLHLSESLEFPGITVLFAPDGYDIGSFCGKDQKDFPVKNKAAQDIIKAYVNLEKNSMGGCRGLTPVSAETVRERLLEYAIEKAAKTV